MSGVKNMYCCYTKKNVLEVGEKDRSNYFLGFGLRPLPIILLTLYMKSLITVSPNINMAGM